MDEGYSSYRSETLCVPLYVYVTPRPFMATFGGHDSEKENPCDVVERTNAWHGRARRHSKDYERKPESSAAQIHLSNIQLMLHRLSPVPHPEFHYRKEAA